MAEPKYIWVTGSRTRKYEVLMENETSYLVRDDWFGNRVIIKHHNVFTDKEEMNYQKFKKYVLSKKTSKERCKYLETTKKRDLAERFEKEFPDKLI